MKTAYVSWRFKTDDDFFGSLKKKLEPATKLHWVDYGTEKRYKDDWLGADLGGQARPHFYDHTRVFSTQSSRSPPRTQITTSASRLPGKRC